MPIAVNEQQKPAKKEFLSHVRDIQASHALDFSNTYGDWRDDLIRDGYAVIPVMSKNKAAEYVERAHDFLESVNLGYNRNDPTTVRAECLPAISEKGMIQHYGISHEDFIWQLRQEPGIIDVFEKVWGTEDLICSFDAFNCTFPNRKDVGPNVPWAHQDQDPDRPGLRCLQGLVNLLPNGPEDGGLIIAKGAHVASEEFHAEFAQEERMWAWTNEFYGYKETGLDWLREKGYDFVKVTAEPGELIVWDSRTPHYNCSPTSSQTRMAAYICMMPASSATQEELINKKRLFEEYKGTTHWPQAVQEFVLPCLRDGKPDPHNRREPSVKPNLSERGLKLTGIPYIKTGSV